MADKSNKDRIKEIQAEDAVQRNLAKLLQERITKTGELTKAQKELVDSVSGQQSIEDKLLQIQQSKEEIILKVAKFNRQIDKDILSQLDTAEQYLKIEKERKDITEELRNYHQEIKDNLYDSLGTLGKMLKAGTALGAAMAALEGLTNTISNGFENTLGFAVELNQTLGTDSYQSLSMGIQNLSTDAIFSRFSIEELNQATRDIATTFGTTAGITNDLRNSVAEMSKFGVGGDDAAKLAQSFERANGSAVDMTTEIKEMAQDSGVMASKTFKDLAAQQRLMVGMSEKEIKLLAKKTIELNKQGFTLSDMKSISESMMDVESTMKAQSKARVLLAGQLNETQLAGMQDMLSASLEFQRTGNVDALNEALKKTNMDAEQFNKLGPRGQELYAQSIGMSAEKLSEVIQSQEQAAKFEKAGILGEAAKGLLETYERVPGPIKEATNGIIAFIAQYTALSILQGKNPLAKVGEGLKATFGKKGGGSDIVSNITDTEGAGGKAGQAAQSSGGGLKSLAEGLKSMGDGKVFAGIGAVALAGPAFIVALPSIPFLLFMGKVKLNALEENFTGLGKGLAQMPQGALGALTMLIAAPALALGMLAIPFLTFMSIPAIGPVIQANFTALAAGLAAFGNPATALFVLIGVGLLASLGAAMIPFAHSLSLLSPLVESFGNIIVGVFGAIPPIITAVANGFATMFSAISMDNIGALLLLGPALMGVAAGLSAVGIMGIPGMLVLTGLSAIAPSLIQMATSLGGLFGGETESAGGSENNTMGELLTEIKGLRQDLQSQPIMITVDGKVVSEISKVQNKQTLTKGVYRK
jgi:hypothetical protein